MKSFFKYSQSSDIHLSYSQAKRSSPTKFRYKYYQIYLSDNQKIGFLDCLGFFFEDVANFSFEDSHESSQFIYAFSQIFGFHQVRNLVNIPTSALTLRKVSHNGDQKLSFLFRLFSDLKTIYSYFIVIQCIRSKRDFLNFFQGKKLRGHSIIT